MLVYVPQFDALARTADSWRADHVDAMGCRDVESLVRILSGLWEQMKRESAAQPIDPLAPDAEARAASIVTVFRTVERAYEAIRDCVTVFADKGYEVEGVADLEAVGREVGNALVVPPERAIRAHRQVAGGQVRPIGEVRRELQGRLRQ